MTFTDGSKFTGEWHNGYFIGNLDKGDGELIKDYIVNVC